ncbi:MAG: hypothetical protein ACI8U3_000710 [Brevundimonas sp.]|jgi:hypothetical protein|uniref:baseplate multidomain protein megatron n=1 Tax=Brevundimonas sp. TaxID=1871086 RepID=UPI0039E3E6D9
MAQVILGGIGGAVGGAFGRALGAFAGASLDRLAVSSLAEPRQRGPRLETLKVQSSADGAPMACVFGRARVTGQVIWAARFLEKRNEQGGGKGGPRTVDYAYSLSFAVALCEGPIDGVGRVWADGRPLDLSGVVMRVHRGTEDQNPDPLIHAVEGGAPAYRGTAYVVFEDLPLGPFGNRAPQLSFEVFRRPRGGAPGLEDRLEGVCLIPGAGEFCLATTPVMRREGLTRTTAENLNNLQGQADLMVSLDQLEAQLPNVRRVNLVVGWFGDDLRMSHCRIRPGVERAVKPTEPVAWSVAGVTRDEAFVVSEADGGPAYGGTPSDQTVIDAVRELKARGMAVTLYPFVFMDIPPGGDQPAYPWRGRITGEGGAAADAEVAAFFGGADDWGLRRMARHYAALAAEARAHGLIIGSELRGVTTLRDAEGGYPAVAELRALAADCRAIVGPGVEISYAADWSEYFGHHPGGGEAVFHLDPLWADPNIDYVAIDWYPPVGDWREGDGHLDAQAGYAGPADADYLATKVAGGENFDWFYASDVDRAAQVRTAITDGAYGEPWVWRSKDLKSWWSNAHHDRPGGVRSATPTAWAPGMKPIRLTEFGCAAVDKGGNGPNLFSDPKSSESFLPPFSTGARDDLMQRRAMEAWLSHFAADANNPVSAVYDGRMVQGLDAWCWDARPYPDFPARAGVWADAGNWRAGHWLNGRLAGEGRDLIAAILKRGGLDETDFAITGVDGAVAGYVIDRPMRTRDALEPLLFAFGAEGGERDGRVAVTGRREDVAVLAADALAMPEDGAPVSAARVLETAPDTVRVRFIDEAADYQAGSVVVRGPDTGGGGLDMDLPAACSAGLAREVAGRALASSAETLTAQLGPLESLRLEPGDAVAVEGRAGVWRVVRLELDEEPRAVLTPWVETGAIDEAVDWRVEAPGGGVGAPFLALLDLPPLPGAEDDGRPLSAVAAEPWRAMQVHGGVDADGLTARASVAAPATVGRLVKALPPGVIGRWDEANALTVAVEGRAPETRSAGAVLNGANGVAVRGEDGWEIVQYRDAELLGGGVWRLSGLLRGQQGTEGEMDAGAGAVAVFLDEAPARLEVQAGERGLPMLWRAGPAGAPPGGDGFSEAALTWRGVHDRPWAPAHLGLTAEDGGLRLRWIARTRQDGDRWDGDAQASDPLRFRVRVLDGAAVVRMFEVEAETALYAAADVAADFPDGLNEDARVAVSQWSPVFGWGVEALAVLG